MSLKDSVSTLTSHFEYITLNFPAIAALQPLQTSTFPITFKATYSQQHMREYLSHTTSCYFTFDPKANPSIAQYPSFPTSENDILVESFSPSKDFRALVRKNADKNILEIWGKYGLLKSARISDAHGSIYNDPQFCLNAISWSQDEKRIVYVAEKKEEKFPKYFDDFGTDEEASRALKSYEYRQDLGETFLAKTTPQIFIYDISEEVHYRVMNIPPEMVPTQVTFADKQGNSLVFCGFNFPGVRAGFRFCYNRDSKIYYLKKFTLERTKEDKTKKLTEEEKKTEKEKLKKEAEEIKPALISNDDIAIFPVLNKDLTKLVYCFSPWSFSHTTGLGLKIVDVPQGDAPAQTPQLLFDVVQEKSDEFVGIMGYHDRLNKMSFFGQKYVFFNSDFKASVSLFVINTETKEVRRIDKPKYQSEEWKLTGIHDGLVFVRVANIEGQNKIAILEGFNPNADSIDEAMKNTKWHHGEMDPAQGSHVKRGPNAFLSQLGEIQEKIIHQAGIESIFFSIKDYKDSNGNIVPDNKKPLMVVLHGGPHGTTTGIYSATRHYTLYKGYNILCPNFTGGTGFGQKFLNDLAGKIGEIDVDEIVATIKYCVDNGLADPKRMVVFGGSYGGFLPGVLLAKFPDMFRTAIIRNPVMSVGYSYESSDIPEWAMCETFNKDMDYEITGEEMKKMFEISPIGMNKDIKTSILLQLGGKDRRVAPEAGLQYYKILKEKGVDISLCWYPDDQHSLAGSQETEADQFIRTFCFLEEKMKVETV